MDTMIFKVQDKKLSELIDVIGRYFGCKISSQVQVKVEGANEEAGGVLKQIFENDDLLRIHSPSEVKRGRPAVITKRSKSFEKEWGGVVKATDPIVPATKGNGYCRNCVGKIEGGDFGMFCSNICRKQYAVRKSQFKNKGMDLDAKLIQKKENGRYEYMTEDEFLERLKLNGWFREGEKVVTPEGHLRVIEMSGGELTFTEYGAKDPSKEVEG